MKPIIHIAVLLFLNVSLWGQQTSLVSVTPTKQELKILFAEISTKGSDPFSVLSAVTERKDNALSALSSILNDTLISQKSKLYAVLSLEGINTSAAYTVLSKIAVTHPDKEIKGVSLRSLSSNYYGKVVNENLIPDKEVIHLLLSNCDDTTSVDFCNKRIGEIAREGINTWTGKDYGNLSLETKTIKVGKSKTEMTLQQYREWWWLMFKDKLLWNKEAMRYDVKK